MARFPDRARALSAAFPGRPRERIEAIKQWLEREKDRPDADCNKKLDQRYLIIKKVRKANIKFLTDFMKKQQENAADLRV